MGLAAEMKDFNAGVQNANKFWDQRADQKLKEAKAADYNRQHQPITDEERANMPGMGGAVGSGLIEPPKGSVPPSNETYNTFLDTVKTGVTNPYALAAISATGKHESGYGDKAYSQWDDVGKPAGGIMSWRDDRLANLKNFAKTDDITKIDAATQGKFFLQENPGMIDQLNKATTVADAQHIMNENWAFAGYRDPNNKEVAGRLADANSYYNQYADAWKSGTSGGIATASAPSTDTSANAGAIPADTSDTSDTGDGTEGEGDSQDAGDDGTQESNAQTPQPVQTAAAAPVIPVPTQVASAAPVQQFAPVQNSGFSSQQPSQQIQPSQQPQAVQPRGTSAGTGVSRVADAILSKEEQAKQAAIQKGALFAKDGGVIPPNFGTPTINQYYARGGTVPKVEHQSTSEWIHDHLPAWLTGEEMGDTIRQTERGIGRPSIPERGQKEDMPREPIKTDRRQQASMDMTSGPREPPPGKDQPPAPIDTSRRQQESMDMTSGPREPPQVPVPPQTVSQQVSAGARPVIPERGQKEENVAPVIPDPDINRRRTHLQEATSGPGQPPEKVRPPQPDQPHTMSRALRPDEQAAPTSAPRERPTKDDTIEQTGPVLPTSADAAPQGPPAPRGPPAPQPTPAPVTPGAARASATNQPLPMMTTTLRQCGAMPVTCRRTIAAPAGSMDRLCRHQPPAEPDTRHDLGSARAASWCAAGWPSADAAHLRAQDQGRLPRASPGTAGRDPDEAGRHSARRTDAGRNPQHGSDAGSAQAVADFGPGRAPAASRKVGRSQQCASAAAGYSQSGSGAEPGDRGKPYAAAGGCRSAR